MRLNKWMNVGETTGKDIEYLKYSMHGKVYQVSFVLYTPVKDEVYFPIVQAVNFTVPTDVINYMEEKDAESVINDLVLDALTEMIQHGIIFNPRTTSNALIVLESMGIIPENVKCLDF